MPDERKKFYTATLYYGLGSNSRRATSYQDADHFEITVFEAIVSEDGTATLLSSSGAPEGAVLVATLAATPEKAIALQRRQCLVKLYKAQIEVAKQEAELRALDDLVRRREFRGV